MKPCIFHHKIKYEFMLIFLETKLTVQLLCPSGYERYEKRSYNTIPQILLKCRMKAPCASDYMVV